MKAASSAAKMTLANTTKAVGAEAKTLIHYTSEAGHASILESELLNAFSGARNARYGAGQYLTDILPGSLSAGKLSYALYRNPIYVHRISHFIEINIEGLEVIYNSANNFRVPGFSPLDISKRIVSSGRTPFPF